MRNPVKHVTHVTCHKCKVGNNFTKVPVCYDTLPAQPYISKTVVKIINLGFVLQKKIFLFLIKIFVHNHAKDVDQKKEK